MKEPRYTLPPQLGGAEVTVTKRLNGRYEVPVAGTPWVITVPGECLKAVLPPEPPSGSIVVGLTGAATRMYQHTGAGWYLAAPGGTTRTSWELLHRSYDEVVVLLDMTPGRARRGWKPQSLSEAGLTVRLPRTGEGGAVVVGSGTRYVLLDQENALRTARAILTCALGVGNEPDDEGGYEG